jgi:homoserine acetyltransferase
MASKDSNEVRYYDLYDFKFQNGHQLAKAQVAYKDLNPECPRVAVVFTCFRGRINSTPTLSNGALHGFRVIVMALFGNGESSSPSNTPDFPDSLDYRDCVRAQHHLLTEHLGIQAVDVMMGFSMGGQCAYYWNSMYPDFSRNAIILCSAARTSRHNFQFLEGPKAALECSADYVSRDPGPKTTKPKLGLKAFGKAYSAWLTSAEWFELGLFKDLGYKNLQDWDKATTETNYLGWDADDLLSMLQMWQNGDICTCDPDGRSLLEDVLGQIKARVLLMPSQTDQYFRWEASQRELGHLKSAKLQIIPSVWGHLAGAGVNQQDADWIDRAVGNFLRAA